METKDITFVIVTFKSENVIFDCIDLLPVDSKKIIIENSNNLDLKISLEKKYENLSCLLMRKNLGYGKGNNIGISQSQTENVFVLNPDTRFKNSDLKKFLNIVKNENYAIAAPTSLNDKEIFNNKDNIKEVEFVKGFAMLLNKKYLRNNYFDENFFLYLEEIDLCKRVKNDGGRILLVNSPIIHYGTLSHGERNNLEMEKSRNWHWMWSKFYYKKKHYGYLIGLWSTLPNFLSSLLKFLFYSLTKNIDKKNIYEMRFLGLLNSYLLKKSHHRPNLEKIK